MKAVLLYWIFFGTNAEGIYRAEFNAETGQISKMELAAKVGDRANQLTSPERVLDALVQYKMLTGYQRAVWDGTGFGVHTVQDLDRDQVALFVNRWYRLAYTTNPPEARQRSRRLLAAIDRSAATRDLAGNPMLLTILAVMTIRVSSQVSRPHLAIIATSADLPIPWPDATATRQGVKRVVGLVR